jgi:hypothetical protein
MVGVLDFTEYVDGVRNDVYSSGRQTLKSLHTCKA